jgi:hypothetical protein
MLQSSEPRQSATDGDSTILAGTVGSWAQPPLAEELDALPTPLQMFATLLARIVGTFGLGTW